MLLVLYAYGWNGIKPTTADQNLSKFYRSIQVNPNITYVVVQNQQKVTISSPEFVKMIKTRSGCVDAYQVWNDAIEQLDPALTTYSKIFFVKNKYKDFSSNWINQLDHRLTGETKLVTSKILISHLTGRCRNKYLFRFSNDSRYGLHIHTVLWGITSDIYPILKPYFMTSPVGKNRKKQYFMGFITLSHKYNISDAFSNEMNIDYRGGLSETKTNKLYEFAKQHKRTYIYS